MDALHVVRAVVVVAALFGLPAACVAVVFAGDIVERLAVGLATGLCLVVAVGLVLDGVRAGYGVAAWAAAMSLVCAVFVIAAARRRRVEPGITSLVPGRAALQAVAVALVAGALAVAALLIARSGLETRDARTAWVELWIEPSIAADGARYAVVGALAHRSHAGPYSVRVAIDGRPAATFDHVDLANGARWLRRVRIPPKRAPAVAATLVGAPRGTLRRRVRIAPQAWSG
jgi:hypothetical protein